jgi:glutamate dehydrogenase (NAD(P)+)
MSHAADVAVKACDFELEGARMVVQGYGAVGKHAARFLAKKGAILVGAADSSGSIYNPEGLDIKELTELKDSGKSVAEYPDGKPSDCEAVIDMACDIWIPAARPDVIHEDNVHRLKTKLIIQGANIPITLEAERILHEKGILSIPDFIANAGGVICAAMEYKGAIQTKALQVIRERLLMNTEQVLEETKKKHILPREAAIALATNRIKQAMSFKRWSIF